MTVSNQRVADEVRKLRSSLEQKMEQFQAGASFGLEVVVDEATIFGFEVITENSKIKVTDLKGAASFYVKLSANSFLLARSGDQTVATLLTAGDVKVRGDISQIDNFQNLSLS